MIISAATKIRASTVKETGNKTEAKSFCMKKHDPQYISREDRGLPPVENKYATHLAKIQTEQPQQGQRILRYHGRERQSKHCLSFILFLASGYMKHTEGNN